MLKKFIPKTKILKALTILIVALLLFIIYKLFSINYDCANTPGVHYCEIGNSSPRLIERLAAIFPESFQVDVGGKILSLRTDIISTQENEEAISLADPIYNRLENDANWANLPTSLGVTYEKILHLSLPQQQYFTYIPKKYNGNLILFAHGLGGNFKSYIYLLSQVADETGSIIIAPTYKTGVWDNDGIILLDKSINDFINRSGIKPSNYIYIGISNGGLPITQYIDESNFKFNKIIALSTYLDPAFYKSDELLNKMGNSHFLYIYGKDDKRIDINSSLESLNYLVGNNINVQSIGLPGDHFIFFSQQKVLLKDIAKFIED